MLLKFMKEFIQWFNRQNKTSKIYLNIFNKTLRISLRYEMLVNRNIISNILIIKSLNIVTQVIQIHL